MTSQRRVANSEQRCVYIHTQPQRVFKERDGKKDGAPISDQFFRPPTCPHPLKSRGWGSWQTDLPPPVGSVFFFSCFCWCFFLSVVLLLVFLVLLCFVLFG